MAPAAAVEAYTDRPTAKRFTLDKQMSIPNGKVAALQGLRQPDLGRRRLWAKAKLYTAMLNASSKIEFHCFGGQIPLVECGPLSTDQVFPGAIYVPVSEVRVPPFTLSGLVLESSLSHR